MIATPSNRGTEFGLQARSEPFFRPEKTTSYDRALGRAGRASPAARFRAEEEASAARTQRLAERLRRAHDRRPRRLERGERAPLLRPHQRSDEPAAVARIRPSRRRHRGPKRGSNPRSESSTLRKRGRRHRPPEGRGPQNRYRNAAPCLLGFSGQNSDNDSDSGIVAAIEFRPAHDPPIRRSARAIRNPFRPRSWRNGRGLQGEGHEARAGRRR